MQQKIVADTYERTIPAGEILIQQGDTGVAAAQLYVVKSGKFEVSKTLLGSPFPMLIVHSMAASAILTSCMCTSYQRFLVRGADFAPCTCPCPSSASGAGEA